MPLQAAVTACASVCVYYGQRCPEVEEGKAEMQPQCSDESVAASTDRT
jgi:hypothetical protein